MPTYPEWEATVLDECYDAIDHVSLHMYFENYENDYLNFLAKPVVMDRYINTIGSVIDYTKAKKRSKKDVHICFDEWNVWYHVREQDHKDMASWDWPIAPPLLEEVYNFEDVPGRRLHPEYVHPPLRSREDCLHRAARERHRSDHDPDRRSGLAADHLLPALLRLALWAAAMRWPRVSVDVPTYDAQVADDVPYLDISAVKNDGKTLTFFAVNRHPDEAMTVNVNLAGFTPKSVVEHMTIAHPI